MKMLSKQYVSTARIARGAGNRRPISESVKEKYAESFYETSTLQSFRDAKRRKDVVNVAYEDLPQTKIAGFPIGSCRNKDGKLEFSFALSSPNTHVINIGTTGSGKTTGFVEPGLRAVSSKKNKPNLFITDPKGELFARNAAHLRRQGYSIFLLNFKDVLHSDCWNPLSEIYDTYTKQKGLKEKIRHVQGLESQSDYRMRGFAEEFGEEFWVFGDRAYPTLRAVCQAYEDELADILSETADLIHQLCHTLIPDSLQGKQDPSWFMGAQEILSGIIYAMLEDAMDERTGFTRDNMNLMTVQNYFDAIRREVVTGGTLVPLQRTIHLSHKSEQDTSIKQLRSYFENAPSTSRSYLGCFRNAMQSWFNNKIFTVCNGDTVKLDADPQKPFAIFLITRDFEKSDFTIAGLFVDWVYRKMLEKADSKDGTLPSEMYFILDEFANIPPIKDFENKIATARSRNIWFQMFVQSYAQLEMVYGGPTAQTIMDNCNTHVFMGSQNYETKSRFSRECGKQTVLSYESVLNPQNRRVMEVPLLSIRKLESIRPGEMYMKRVDMPLIRTEFIRSFLCEEFAEKNPATPENLGIESLPFTSEKYRYQFLESNMCLSDFAREREKRKADPFLEFLNEADRAV